MGGSLLFYEIILFVIGALVSVEIVDNIIRRIRYKKLYKTSTKELVRNIVIMYIVLGLAFWIHFGYPYAFIYIVWIIEFFESSHALTI